MRTAAEARGDPDHLDTLVVQESLTVPLSDRLAPPRGEGTGTGGAQALRANRGRDVAWEEAQGGALVGADR